MDDSARTYAGRVTKTHLVFILLSCSLLLPQPTKQRHRLVGKLHNFPFLTDIGPPQISTPRTDSFAVFVSRNGLATSEHCSDAV
jgi:hypothetical protein